MNVKFEFSSHRGKWLDPEDMSIEAPNVNVALMKLLMEVDLSDISTIYITAEEKEEDDYWAEHR